MEFLVRGVAGWLRSLPDGALLRLAFHGTIGIALVLVMTDLRESFDGRLANPFAMPARNPVRMDRPEPADQIRPYLPYTRPVAPGDDAGRFRDRPREESEAAPMQFRLGTHGSAFAEGTITPGTAEAFETFLAGDRAAGVTELVLHSPGGSVGDATQMAKLIHERKLATRILPDGYCASSCPLVFAGGTERIADATAWIGVHQAFALADAVGSLAEGMEQAQRVSAETQELLYTFGVDPRVWTRAMQTPKEQLYLFTPEELLELKLATEVEGMAEGEAAGS